MFCVDKVLLIFYPTEVLKKISWNQSIHFYFIFQCLNFEILNSSHIRQFVNPIPHFEIFTVFFSFFSN